MSDRAQTSNAPVSGFTSIMQMMGGLAFVLALFLLCAWLMKRVQGGFVSGGSQMKLLAGLSVGTRERVVLLEVKGAQVLLGVAPGRISALHVFPVDEGDTRKKELALDNSALGDGLLGEGVGENSQHRSAVAHEDDSSGDFAAKLKQLLSQSSGQRGDK
jgi:flagellar biosynthetic protein FliO